MTSLSIPQLREFTAPLKEILPEAAEVRHIREGIIPQAVTASAAAAEDFEDRGRTLLLFNILRKKRQPENCRF